MNKNQLLEIISANPWQTRISLTKLCASKIVGIDNEDHGTFVGELLAALLEEEAVVKEGKARGTRYAKAGETPHQKPKITDAQRKAVSDTVEGGTSKSTEIAEAAGVDLDLTRKILRELHEAGSIDKTGSTKSTRYWPKGKAPTPQPKPTDLAPAPSKKAAPPKAVASSSAVAVPLIENQSSVISGETNSARVDMEPEPELPQISPFEALCQVIESLPRRKLKKKLRQDGAVRDTNVFSFDEIETKVERRFGVPKYEISKLIRSGVFGKMGEGASVPTVVHCQMRYAYKTGNPGWAAYIWRPANDKDERPPAYQHRSEATFDAWTEADHEAANQVRSGRPFPKKEKK